MNQPYGVNPGPYPQAPIGSPAADGRARWSMYLGAASFLLTCFAGVPAIILGASALNGASPAAKKQAFIGIGLAAFTSLGTAALMGVLALMPTPPAKATATPEARSKEAASLSAGPAASVPPSAAEALPEQPTTALDAWAARGVDNGHFDIGVDESWAVMPAGTTDCGADGGGKPLYLDRPSISDQFAARRQEEQRPAIAKKYSGRIVNLTARDVSVEFGEYAFVKEMLPIKVVARGHWPLGGQIPTFRRESDRIETKQKIAELGGKDLNVTREQDLVRFENTSAIAFTAKVPKEQAERWTKGEGKPNVLIVQRFLGLGFHKVCQNSCARILGVNECSPINVGFGEYNRAELIGYRVVIDDAVVAEKQPHGPPPAE